MRISNGRGGWLAAVSLALGLANADFVTFTTGFENGAVLNLDDPSTSSRAFGWIVKTGFSIVVDEVKLWGISPGSVDGIELASGKNRGQVGDQTPSAAPSTLPDSNSLPMSPPTRFQASRRQNGNTKDVSPDPEIAEEKLEVRADETGGHVTFSGDLSWFVSDPSQSLFFEANWADGSSYSRAFIILPFHLRPDNATMYTIPTPHKAESGAPPKDDQDDGGTGVIFVDPGPAATETATESAEPSPPGGLPQGAIIGIAVTCSIIGLLLIGGLVWFLLRRRRQAQAMHAAGPPYGSGSRADELMAEKEAAAAADVDASPHSPYSDDGAPATAGPNGTYPNGASHGGEAVAAGAVGTAAASSPAAHSRPLPDAPRSFTPYSDRPGAAAAGTPSVRAASVAQADEPQVTVPSATPGRATPRVPIAHLVEDGMTEDEIRRLEEEERQLDAAIEQAGRR